MVCIYRGEDKQLAFTIQEGGVDVNLTTAEHVHFTVTRFPGGTKVIDVDATIDAVPTTGEVTVDLSALQTDIEDGTYYYELEVEFQDGTHYLAKQDYLTIMRRI